MPLPWDASAAAAAFAAGGVPPSAVEPAGPDPDLTGLEGLAMTGASTSPGPEGGPYGDGREAGRLAEAVLARGCLSLLYTLWPPDPEVGRRVAEGFLRRVTDGLGPAEALRKAQVHVMRSASPGDASGDGPRHSHPHYWAPFVAAGFWKDASTPSGKDGKK
jgi:hypothetical protein